MFSKEISEDLSNRKKDKENAKWMITSFSYAETPQY